MPSRGVKTFSGATYQAQAVVLATGTYLNARCIYGDVEHSHRPRRPAGGGHLTDSLKAHGIETVSLQDRDTGPGGWRSGGFFQDGGAVRAMSRWFAFRFLRIRDGAEGSGVLLADLLPTRKPTGLSGRIWTVPRCFPAPSRGRDPGIVRLSRTKW